MISIDKAALPAEHTLRLKGVGSGREGVRYPCPAPIVRVEQEGRASSFAQILSTAAEWDDLILHVDEGHLLGALSVSSLHAHSL